MIRVGVIATARQRHGGTLLYTLSMLDALTRLPKSAYQVTIFAEPDNHEYDVLGLPIAPMPSTISLLGGRLLGRHPFTAVDVFLSPVYSVALLVCSRPFAFTLHDLQERHYPENFSLMTRIWRRGINWLLSIRAKRIICESDFVRNDIVRYINVKEEKVVVIAAPPIALLLDSAIGGAAIDIVRSKFSLPPTYVFYPAQFWLHKNHRRLVEAFAIVLRQYPECALVLTGKPRDEYDRVFELVHQLGLASSVRHIGYVEQSDLAALYRGATVAAIPTLFESISIPIYEAFSVGTAVCASNVVAIPEQVGDAGLLFDPHSIEDIAEKICTLLSSQALRENVIKNGYRRMQSITHDQYAIRLSKLISKIHQMQNE